MTYYNFDSFSINNKVILILNTCYLTIIIFIINKIILYYYSCERECVCV